MFGEEYNFVGLDPRGVGNSGPKLDCFRNSTKARAAFNRAHYTGATNTSSHSFEEQYYSADIYGDWCNKEVKAKSPYGYYVTSPAVAQDLLTFLEADAKLAGREPSEAKLWGFGNSYGSVIGTTFASMFPDRVGRLILESVMDADEYCDNNWRSNFLDSDKAFEQLPILCHAAGPNLCSFWGPTPKNIKARIDAIIQNIISNPMPVSGIDGHTLPGLATYSDLKMFIANGLYEPRTYFPILADTFAELENGNASSLIGWSEKLFLPSDVDVIIRCADSYKNNKLIIIEDWKDYIEDSVSRSKYIGDVFPIWARTILCRSLKPQLPDSMMLKGRVSFPTAVWQ
jgi:pimeloyl-ACP methyl ester carboxylesterase